MQNYVHLHVFEVMDLKDCNKWYTTGFLISLPTLCIIIWKLPCKLLRREEKDGYLSTQSLICCCRLEGSIETHICSNELSVKLLTTAEHQHPPPSLLTSFLSSSPSSLCFLPRPSLGAITWPLLFASLHSLICFVLYISPSSHSRNVAGSKSGPIVSLLSHSQCTSYVHVLASEHHIQRGYTSCSFSHLIINVQWLCFYFTSGIATVTWAAQSNTLPLQIA